MSDSPSHGPTLRSGERRFNAESLADRARRVGNGLRAWGLSESDSVAGLLRNDVAFFDLLEGAALAGVRFTPVNWHLSTEEISYILEDCDAKLIVVHQDFVATALEAIGDRTRIIVVPTPPEIITAYQLGALADVSSLTQWEPWLSAQASQAVETPTPGVLMLYTSGSTGKPKGVRRIPQSAHAQRSYLEGIGRAFGLRREARVIMTGPLYHAAPLGYARIAMQLGCDLLLMPRFDAEGLLKAIETERLTHMHMVPIMFYRLLMLPDSIRGRYDLSSLESVCHGAAPCPVEVKRQMIEWWGPVIREYYGSTEASLACGADAQEWLARPGTVGRPLPGVTLKIFDEQGQPVGPGEPGEIFVRHGGAPDFDYHNRSSDRRTIEHEGLFSNGDIGYQDEEGYVYLCDRKRDMIISGGVNIYPAEIEAALLTHPAVADCAVFSVPDDEYGESIVAVVEPAHAVTKDELVSFLNTKIARFKIPRQFRFETSLPRHDNGKIYKRRLREAFLAEQNPTNFHSQ